MICYGKVGSNIIYRCGQGVTPGDDLIEMQHDRPDEPYYVAQADGTWIEDAALRAEWESNQG